jgi:hypothetical protein
MGEIKTRFRLEGEQQYKKAMTEAANAVKVLNSEQKLAKAQFKNTGDAEKYAAQQSDILKKKIEQQKQAVAAAEAALKNLANNGVKENDKQFQQWQLRLNSAQTALAQMETELNNVGNGMGNVAGRTSQMVDSLNSINKKVSLDMVISGIGKITDAMESAGRVAVRVGQSIWDNIMDSAEYADDVATLATKMELTTDELQRMMYVEDRFEVSAEDMAKTWKKLRKNIASDSSEVTKSFKDLRIATHEMVDTGFGKVEGKTRDYKEVFWEVGNALMRMTDISERERIAQTLLGKSWDDMIPLFKAGRQAYEDAMASVSVVDEETIQKGADLNDRIKELEKQWTMLKTEALAALAPALQKAADALGTLLQRVTDYLKTDEGQEKLQKMEDAVSKLFGDLSNIDPEDVVDKFAGVLEKITTAFTWIGDHWNDVKLGIEGIGIAFGALKLTSVALNLGKIVSGFQTLWNGANKKLPSAPDVPQQPTTGTTPKTTAPKATAPTVAPTNLPINTGAPSVSPTVYATVPGLTSMVGTGGMGGAVGGIGTLSLVGALGGSALIAGGVYLTAEMVNEVNRAAEKMREVKEDLHRYDNFLTEETIREASGMAYVSGPMGDKRLVLQDTVRKLMKTTGSATGINSYENIMKWLGYNLNKNVLEAFNYTNTSGDSRNKLMDMLGMDDQRAATAAMILKSAGYTYNDSRLSTEQQSLFQEGLGALKKINDLGNTLGTEGFGTIIDFFKTSGVFNEDGEWTIPGLEEEMAAQQAAADAMNAASETMSGLPEAVAAAVSGVTLQVQWPFMGSHANGLPFVPFDGYALLHKGERVLTAREARTYNANSNLYIENMNMNNGMDAQALAAAMNAQNQRVRAGYGW